MDTSYIYAGTRAKTLEQGLLTETQAERLMSAKSVSEVYSVLQDTFLAMHLLKHNEKEITDALDEYIVDARKTLQSIAPNKEVLDVMWLRYDYHNLKTILKGKRKGLGNDEIKKTCFAGGKYSPDEIFKAFEDGTLNRFNNTSRMLRKRQRRPHTSLKLILQ
jgi:vacuolar-type H+-ATPase subunit C/Vma6